MKNRKVKTSNSNFSFFPKDVELLIKHDENFRKVFNNYNRMKIFELCQETQIFSKLKEKLNISTGALFHHLSILEFSQAIVKERDGQKVNITINKKLIDELKEKDARHLQQQYKKQIPNYLVILEKIKKENNYFKLEEEFPDDDFIDVIFNNEPSLVELSIKLSEEGEAFLKKYSKD